MLILNKPKWGLFAILYSNSGHSVIIFLCFFFCFTMLFFSFVVVLFLFFFFVFFASHCFFFSLFISIIYYYYYYVLVCMQYFCNGTNETWSVRIHLQAFIQKHGQTQAGSNISRQICWGQDTRVFQEHAWVDDRRTMSKGLDNRGNPSTRAIIQTGQTESKRQDERAIQKHKSNDQNMGKQARQD